MIFLERAKRCPRLRSDITIDGPVEKALSHQCHLDVHHNRLEQRRSARKRLELRFSALGREERLGRSGARAPSAG